MSEHRYYKTRAEEMLQIENIFNELESEGLNQVLNQFYNAFRELSNQPESETIRSVIRDKASIVVKDFHRIQELLNELSSKLDNQLRGQVEAINSHTKHIAYLNKKIISLEAAGDETGDLRDQRDLAIKKLSESFKNSYIPG